MKVKLANSTKPGLDAAVLEIAEALKDDDTRLLIYFASTCYDPATLARQMASAFPGVTTVGCTTAGEIISGRMLEHSISAMALGSQLVVRAEARLLRTVAANAREAVTHAFASLSQAFGHGMTDLDHDRYVGIILADGLSVAEERLMDAIGDKTNIAFVGGSAGDDLKFQKTQVFVGPVAASDAAVLVVMEAAVPFQILKTQSFRALPQKLVATKVNEPMRRVLEFNGKPAAVAYAEAVGTTIEQASSRFMTNPVGLVAGEEIFVRSPQRIEDTSIYFYCSVVEGTELALLESTDIVADTQKAIGKVSDASAIIDFDCILRTLELRQKGQCDAYGGIFAQTPTVGFSTYGEEYIGHINQTSTMLVFRSQ
jgi:hypothetical protein